VNLAQLRLKVRPRIGNPSVTDVPDSTLTGVVNDAYQEVFNKYKFKLRRRRGKFNTVIGSDKYDISGLTNVVYKVWDRTNGRELEFVGTNVLAERDYDAVPNNLVQNGRPEKWAHQETYLQILPPPDGVYSIEMVYKVIFTPLINDTDIPVIPDTWHRGLAILAAALYYGDIASDPVKEKFHRDAFTTWVADQPVEEHEETEAIDSGVEIPTLATPLILQRKPDGVWWDILP
jgi:hypothetical protein